MIAVVYLFLCMMALNAIPSRHEDVKSVTRTPGYFDVDFRAHFNNASRADTFGSSPTTMSDICKEKKNKNQQILLTN